VREGSGLPDEHHGKATGEMSERLRYFKRRVTPMSLRDLILSELHPPDMQGTVTPEMVAALLESMGIETDPMYALVLMFNLTT
jgi:hypothetical protein